jgi:hypothetical protein
MLELCKNLPYATFPVRASILPSCWDDVKRLIQKDGFTLTIWNSEPLDNDLKNWIFKNTDPKKCFYDIKIIN